MVWILNNADASRITDTNDAITQSMRLALLTHRTDRVGRPEYGTTFGDLGNRRYNNEAIVDISEQVEDAMTDIVVVDTIDAVRLGASGLQLTINGRYQIDL